MVGMCAEVQCASSGKPDQHLECLNTDCSSQSTKTHIKPQAIIISTFLKLPFLPLLILFVPGPHQHLSASEATAMCRWFCGKMHFPELLQVGCLKSPVWLVGCMHACLCKWSAGLRLEWINYPTCLTFLPPRADICPGHRHCGGTMEGQTALLLDPTDHGHFWVISLTV